MCQTKPSFPAPLHELLHRDKGSTRAISLHQPRTGAIRPVFAAWRIVVRLGSGDAMRLRKTACQTQAWRLFVRHLAATASLLPTHAIYAQPGTSSRGGLA